MARLLLYCIIILWSSNSYAQIPDGTSINNYTLTDINGNTRDLYSYLNAGKVIVIDFMHANCGPCFSYHNYHQLDSFYQEHGPNGTDKAVVFMIDVDDATGAPELSGNNTLSYNWVANTPFPIINLGWTDQIVSDFQTWGVPAVYKICSDKKAYHIETLEQAVPAPTYWVPHPEATHDSLETWMNSTCNPTLTSFTQISTKNIGQVFPNPVDDILRLENVPSGTYQVTLINNLGQQIRTQTISILDGNTHLDVLDLNNGIYWLQLVNANKQFFTKQFIVQQNMIEARQLDPTEISLTDLENGLYIVQLTNNNKVFTRKVVKQIK